MMNAMNKRARIAKQAWCVGFVLAAILTPPDGSCAERQPNVIVILTDDQGYADMSCHGNPYLKTPALDRLFAEGVRLTDFHVDPSNLGGRHQVYQNWDFENVWQANSGALPSLKIAQ